MHSPLRPHSFTTNRRLCFHFWLLILPLSSFFFLILKDKVAETLDSLVFFFFFVCVSHLSLTVRLCWLLSLFHTLDHRYLYIYIYCRFAFADILLLLFLYVCKKKKARRFARS